MNGITWLHLSDWHQRGQEFDRKVVRDALMRDIRGRGKISPELSEIDFVFVTGDIAYSGRTEEYEAAVEYFFRPLMLATGSGNDSWDRLFIVPGNHDINRDIVKSLDSELKVALDSPQAVQKVLQTDWKRKGILSAFSGYESFVKKYIKNSISEWIGDSDYSYQKIVDAGGKKVAIVGFNSAWYSARNLGPNGDPFDYGSLIVGEPQVYDKLNEVENNCDVVISLMHHPLSWLVDFDRDVIEERLTRRCHFILHGHEHLPRVYFSQSTIGDVMIIPGGASYDRRQSSDSRFTNAYNFVHLDFDTSQGTVYPRRWSDSKGEWIEDREMYSEGRFYFTIPKSQDPLSPVKKAARDKLIERYKPALRKRFCDEIKLSMRHRVEDFNGIKLVRHDVLYELNMSSGAPDSISHQTFGSDRVIKMVEDGILNVKPYESHYFRVGGQNIEPKEKLKDKVHFTAQLDEKESVVEYKYTIYLMPEDVYLMRIWRFAHKFKFQLLKDKSLDYVFSSVGGLSLPQLKQDEMFEYYEAESTELCFPDQGYLIHWYPLDKSTSRMKTVPDAT